MWRLAGNVASLESESLSATIDASSLDMGLRDVQWFDGKSRKLVPGPLLKILIPRNDDTPRPRLAEIYVRGADLVASYDELTKPRVRPQVYWRAIASGNDKNAVGIEVILSIQTSVLDSRPTILVESQLGANQIRTFPVDADGTLVASGDMSQAVGTKNGSRACLFLTRLEGTNLSYLEMAYPADFHDASVQQATQDSVASVRYELHTERLEKGVIRRCRIRSLFVPTSGDEASAGRCFQEFLSSPVPLTT